MPSANSPESILVSVWTIPVAGSQIRTKESPYMPVDSVTQRRSSNTWSFWFSLWWWSEEHDDDDFDDEDDDDDSDDEAPQLPFEL
jgi:hypothetical protein